MKLISPKTDHFYNIFAEFPHFRQFSFDYKGAQPGYEIFTFLRAFYHSRQVKNITNCSKSVPSLMISANRTKITNLNVSHKQTLITYCAALTLMAVNMSDSGLH